MICFVNILVVFQAKGGELVEGKEEKQDKKVVEEVKKEKLVIATKKGSAVLDQWLPDHIKTHYHVLKMVLCPYLFIVVFTVTS